MPFLKGGNLVGNSTMYQFTKTINQSSIFDKQNQVLSITHKRIHSHIAINLCLHIGKAT